MDAETKSKIDALVKAAMEAPVTGEDTFYPKGMNAAQIGDMKVSLGRMHIETPRAMDAWCLIIMHPPDARPRARELASAILLKGLEVPLPPHIEAIAARADMAGSVWVQVITDGRDPRTPKTEAQAHAE